jgi:intermediate peptidase
MLLTRRRIAQFFYQKVWVEPQSTTKSTTCRSFANSTLPERGLFSIPELFKPSDFPKCAANAMYECDQLRSNLAGCTVANKAEATNVLYKLDEISKLICNVIDAAELCRSVHATEQWRESAHHAFTILADYIAQLNGDDRLYAALLKVVSLPLFNELTQEERRFAILLKAEFERDGIQLPEAQRLRLQQITNQVTELEGLFQRNIVQYHKTFVSNATHVKDVLPTHVLQTYGITNADADGLTLTLTSDPQILQSLIRYSTSPELRRQCYVEHATGVPDNLQVLEALVGRRNELAGALGFGSYADRTVRDKMAKTPQTVLDFLRQLQTATRPIWKLEMEHVAQAKQAVEGNSVVEPWDVAFYTGCLKAQDGFDVASITPYLSVDSCVQGMRHIVKSLLGMTMHEEEMSETERWDGTASDSSQKVRRFVFLDETGDSFGTMYLDLYGRKGKYGHAAHFTVRCGCVSNGTEEPPIYQTPIVALVCNLSAGQGLSHSEVETLYHEFGHGLHSLFSRTKFQHMSGTRAAMDFVETPSHVMENFAWDPTFLKRIAVHHVTGEPISNDLIEKLRQSRYEFAAIERQNQILYAQFDQMLFGMRDESLAKLSTIDLFAKLHHDTGVPYAQGTHWHTRFGHLVTYGASYYSYLYSQVFARDIWHKCFQGDPLSRSAGEQYWHKLLIHGGSRDPELMLTDLLGRPPKVNNFD